MSEELIQLEPRRSAHIPRPIDNTALNDYMTCPRKYFYGMVRNRRRRGGSLSPSLAYGTTWHAILEAHYKTGGNLEAVLNAAHKSWVPHNNPDDHRTLDRAILEYRRYLDQYGTFEQEVVGWGQSVGFDSGKPLVEMPVELWWPGLIHPYTGKIDRIFEHHGLYYVEDHKSTGQMGPNYFRQFDPSNQMMGYAMLAKKLTGLTIAGVRINGHAVLKGSSKFARQTIMISDDRLDEWSANLNNWMEQLEVAHSRIETPDSAFPANYNACAGKYGQCQYTEVCTYDRTLRDRILEAEFEENEWNPLNAEDGGGE